MQEMREDARAIKEQVARAKAYINRLDYLRGLAALAEALELLDAVTVFGRERAEVEILLSEALRTLTSMEQLSSIFPQGAQSLSFKRGQEKKLAAHLRRVHGTISRAIEQAELGKVRKRKNELDQFIIAGQKEMSEGNHTEARKLFRRISEKYPDEPGLLQDIGVRMLRGGMVVESVEYLERAIQDSPRDPRPYANLVDALEMLGEMERAEQAVLEALRNFGASDRTYLRMAQVYAKMKRWDKAYDAARAAQDLNPFSREAAKLVEALGKRVFVGTGKGGKAKAKPAPAGKAAPAAAPQPEPQASEPAAHVFKI